MVQNAVPDFDKYFTHDKLLTLKVVTSMPSTRV